MNAGGVIYLTGVVTGGFIGAAVTSGFFMEPQLARNNPTEFKSEELVGETYVLTKPLEMKLRIAPWAEYKKDHSNMAAYSRPFAAPCEIIMPEGWWIKVNFSNYEATWLTKDDGDTLAHEILHCLKGRWHPQ